MLRKTIILFVGSLITVLCSSCGMLRGGINLPPDYLPHRVDNVAPEKVARFAEFAVLADYSYHDPERIIFDLAPLEWVQVDADGRPEVAGRATHKDKRSGFACDILEQQGSDQTIIAYRGTDEQKDYWTANFALFYSKQYKQALEVYDAYVALKPERKI